MVPTHGSARSILLRGQAGEQAQDFDENVSHGRVDRRRKEPLGLSEGCINRAAPL
jgi:hypothetical protein